MEIYCDKILMSVQPVNSLTIEQFVRPFCTAIRYQNFITVATAAAQKFRRVTGEKFYVMGHIRTRRIKLFCSVGYQHG